MVVIGGAAVSLGYVTTHATSDIDLWTDPGPGFWSAVARCRRDGEAIPIAIVTIASPPYDFEDRLRFVDLPGLERLTIQVPERHDLAMPKIARAEAHDLDAIEDIHRQDPLVLEVLLERYAETLTQITVPEGRFRLNLLALVARPPVARLAPGADQIQAPGRGTLLRELDPAGAGPAPQAGGVP